MKVRGKSRVPGLPGLTGPRRALRLLPMAKVQTSIDQISDPMFYCHSKASCLRNHSSKKAP
jgi:hypothetical protein